jgi:hypothetical protein
MKAVLQQPAVQEKGEAAPKRRPIHYMSSPTRRAVGTFNAIGGAVSLAGIVAACGLCERLVAAQESGGTEGPAAVMIDIFGWEIGLTLIMGLLLLGAAGGVVGSFIQQGIVFAARSGWETLQCGFVWWYLLRPIWSGLLGAVLVAAINAGVVSYGDTTTSAAGVTMLATAGTLAGLFTDQVLGKLRNVLGATDVRVPVTESEPVDEPQPAPHAAPQLAGQPA